MLPDQALNLVRFALWTLRDKAAQRRLALRWRPQGILRMSWILIATVLFVALAVLAALKNRQGGPGTGGFPYRPAKALFSPAERSFLGVLDQATGPEHRVFGKVRVADIAALNAGLSNSARQGALNRVAEKHFDFVVCRANDLAVLCAVELNDASHSGQRAQARDEFLAKVCQAIGLPLLTVPARQSYLPHELRAQFSAALSPTPSPEQVGADRSVKRTPAVRSQ